MKTIKSILEESKKLKKEVSDAVLKRKEELYVELKKKRKEFEDRYGEDADKVMHSTAMNMAKKEMSEEELQRRTMKDFDDHTPKEDDAGAYHKLVKRSGKRVADKDELDEALRGRDYEYDEKEGVVKISKKNFAKVRKDAKGTIDQKKNPTMMVLTKKGTSLVPVKFTEAWEIGTDEYRKYLEDLTPMEGARRDAYRDMKKAGELDSKDDDDEPHATKDDRKAANKNILQQLKKTIDTKGKANIEFLDKKKNKVPYKVAVEVIRKYMSMRRSGDKLKFQQKVAKSYRDMLAALKENYELPKTHKETILDRIDTKIKERKNG